MSGLDSKYFSTTRKGEIPELKGELNSQYKDKRKDAVKKVIAAMTVGKDVSSLFTDVLNCMQTENLELKKLVYLYLINYAKSQPDLAILAVNTFVKDSQDPNPLIRALAVRTMGCIRVDKITEYLCDPLQRCIKDDDPYVRKTAAVCVAKLYDINTNLVEDRGFLEALKDLISDNNPMVVANAIVALAEIQGSSCRPIFDITIHTLSKLLTALNEFTDATVETDNPDLRDRAYIYWRLLSTDPEAAKDVVLAEKPVISDDSNQLDPSLLDDLLANIATLSSVYHKPPDAFVTHMKSVQRTEDDEYLETGKSESPAHALDSAASLPATSSSVPHAVDRQLSPAPAAPVPDLLGDLIGLDDNKSDDGNNSIVSVDQPTLLLGPPLPVLLPASTGQGLQISAQLVRRDGQIFYSLFFENNSQIPLDGFMIQFNKNTFGLVAAAQLQIPQLQPGTSARTLLPMILFQSIAPGPPTTLLQVAVKNNQQPVWYFNDKISLLVFFTEDGRMERSAFLQTWKYLPDSNEVSKDFPGIVMNSVEATLDKVTVSNMFFIAKRKNANQEVLYLSAKIPRGIPFLIEVTGVIGIPGLRCAIKTPNPEMAPLFFEAIENLLKS